MSMRRREFITLLGGAVAAWPLAARAQQPTRMPRIGILEALTETDVQGRARIAALRNGLERLGWTEGNVGLEYRWGGVDLDRGRAYAAELVGLAPDVIFVDSAPDVAIMREQTRAIPIVFIQSGDPVRADAVQSFARPGGNLTGFLQSEPTINTKYLQLLKDIAPNVTRAAVLQSQNSTWRGDFPAIEAVARSFAVTPISVIVHSDAEIEQAIIAVAQEPNGGLIVLPDANNNLHRKSCACRQRRSLPSSSIQTRTTEAGRPALTVEPAAIDARTRMEAEIT
jgi:putative ABC transport system substrate-binding protein